MGAAGERMADGGWWVKSERGGIEITAGAKEARKRKRSGTEIGAEPKRNRCGIGGRGRLRRRAAGTRVSLSRRSPLLFRFRLSFVSAAISLPLLFRFRFSRSSPTIRHPHAGSSRRPRRLLLVTMQRHGQQPPTPQEIHRHLALRIGGGAESGCVHRCIVDTQDDIADVNRGPGRVG